jgi:DNA-binding NtrC family response regulator
MIRTNDLEVPDMSSLKPMSPVPSDFRTYERSTTTSYPSRETEIQKEDYHGPIIIESPHDRTYQQSEEVEENLSIEDMEKDLIKKALKKYKGRRKDAARELGISERTLYRKIKQYDIPD